MLPCGVDVAVAVAVMVLDAIDIMGCEVLTAARPLRRACRHESRAKRSAMIKLLVLSLLDACDFSEAKHSLAEGSKPPYAERCALHRDMAQCAFERSKVFASAQTACFLRLHGLLRAYRQDSEAERRI